MSVEVSYARHATEAEVTVVEPDAVAPLEIMDCQDFPSAPKIRRIIQPLGIPSATVWMLNGKVLPAFQHGASLRIHPDLQQDPFYQRALALLFGSDEDKAPYMKNKKKK